MSDDLDTGGQKKTFMGHPRGLATLFFTEMWERFSYYGMRAILILYMTAEIVDGGLNLDDREAAAVYGLYTMFVYLLALPGGWLADRFFGLRKAVWYGGILIAIGHFSMAMPVEVGFYIGLLFIVLGTGLLKPNISSIVGGLYRQNEPARRDAGFSIFYMGINIGAFIAPLIVGWLGENIDWHYGFGAAGIGMVMGLVQYKLTEKHLGDVGLSPEKSAGQTSEKKVRTQIRNLILIFLIGLALLVWIIFNEMILVNPVALANVSAYAIVGAFVSYFVYLLYFQNLTIDEKKKIGALTILFVFAALFWSGFEQAGSSLNLFADRYTDREIFGSLMPASWLQAANPLFIILLAPFVGALWINLARINLHPYTPVKFGFGLLFLGLGFAVMAWASMYVIQNTLVLPSWLIFTYLFHTTGELCVSPIGLSAVTKLAPKRLVGQLMGVWFMSTAFGNLIAGLAAGAFDEKAISEDAELLPRLFLNIVFVAAGSGTLLLILHKPITKLMKNVH
ncbi:MAG: peptide MFS transporter [Candidatus Curtissbacteria bacterium]